MGSYSCCKKSALQSKKITSLSSLLKVITERSRLQLLCVLRNKKHCVCELMEHVDMSQSLVSHHLKDLKKVRIVTNKKEGLKVYYSLTAKGKKIINLLFKI